MQPAVPKRARCSPILMAAGLAAAGLAGLPSANGQMGITEWQPVDYWTACDGSNCPATDREVDSRHCPFWREEKCRPALRPYTTCKPGEKVSVPGTDHANRKCEACPDDRFTAVDNAAQCQVPKTCQRGQFVKSQPTKTVDRVCAPCGASTFSDNFDAPTCRSHETCMPGEYEKEKPTPSSDRGCLSCGPNVFSTDENQPFCKPHTTCQPGNRVDTIGTQNFDTACAPCAAGYFTTENNARQCKPHQPCVPPLEALSEGTTTADRACGMEPACATSMPPGTDNKGADYEDLGATAAGVGTGTMFRNGGGEAVENCASCARICTAMANSEGGGGESCSAYKCSSTAKRCWLYNSPMVKPLYDPASFTEATDNTQSGPKPVGHFCVNGRAGPPPAPTVPKWTAPFTRYRGEWRLVAQNVQISISHSYTTKVEWTQSQEGEIRNGLTDTGELGSQSRVEVQVGRTDSRNSATTSLTDKASEDTESLCNTDTFTKTKTKGWTVSLGLEGKAGGGAPAAPAAERQRRQEGTIRGDVEYTDQVTEEQVKGSEDCNTKMVGLRTSDGVENAVGDEVTQSENRDELKETRNQLVEEYSQMLTKTFGKVMSYEQTTEISFKSHCGEEGNQNVYQFFITAWSDEIDPSTDRPTAVLLPTDNFQCVGDDNHKPRCPPAQCAGEDCACCNSDNWVPAWYRSEVNVCTCHNDQDEALATLSLGETLVVSGKMSYEKTTNCAAAAVKGMCNDPSVGYKVIEFCPCNCLDAEENSGGADVGDAGNSGSKGSSSGTIIGVVVALVVLALGGAAFFIKKRRDAAAEERTTPLKPTAVVSSGAATATPEAVASVGHMQQEIELLRQQLQLQAMQQQQQPTTAPSAYRSFGAPDPAVNNYSLASAKSVRPSAQISRFVSSV